MSIDPVDSSMSSCDLFARNIDLWFNKSVHVTSFTSRRVRFMSCTVLSNLRGFLVLVFCPCKLQRAAPTQLDIWLRTSDGLVTSNQIKVTELFANYFTTGASNIEGDHVNNLSENDHQFHNSVETIREVQSRAKFYFTKFRQGEITSALDTLIPSKSIAWNHGVLPILLKKLAKVITLSLTCLYNECTKSRKWPTH